MDSVLFQAMAAEVGRKFAGSRLDKVVQVTAGTLVLKFWTGQEKLQLLLKADGGAFFETRASPSSPVQPAEVLSTSASSTAKVDRCAA